MSESDLESLIVWGLRRFEILQLLTNLTPEQRLEVFAHFCKSCGSDNPRCQCWNDE